MRKLILLTLLFSQFAFTQRVFDTQYGGGSTATGGRNGVLVIVTTLDTSVGLTSNTNAQGETYYTGGVSAAFSDNIGARYVIFNLSGNIDVGGGSVTINDDNVTVFGQSAPQGGITFHNGSLVVASSNVILRYVRARNGNATQAQMDGSGTTGSSGYGIVVRSASQDFDDVMLDHVSASWGGDKAVLFGHNQAGISQKRHTIQRSLLSDSHTYLQLSTQNTANIPNHTQISVIANLFARGQNRTPNIGGTGDYVDVINNIVQAKNANKLGVIQWCDDANFNWSRNYYQYLGSNSYGERNEWQWSGGSVDSYNPTGQVFDQMSMHATGNYYKKIDGATTTILLDGTENVDKNDNAVIWGWRNLAGGSGEYDYYQFDRVLADEYFVANEFTGIPNPPPLMTAAEAYTSIVTEGNVGACHYMKDDGTVGYYMDSWDANCLTDVANETMNTTHDVSQWILPTLPTNTRPASYDTDFDGMADAWEISEFGDLNQGYNDDFDSDGRPNIEEYYAQVDGNVVVVNGPTITLTGNPTVNLNLNDSYTDLGATATDVEDGDLTSVIAVTGTVDTSIAGTYYLYFNVIDSDTNAAIQKVRTIVVTDPSDTEAPTPPTSVIFTNVTSTSFTASWSGATDNVGVVSYPAEIDNSSKGTVVGTFYNASNLSPNTTYDFTVFARDAAGNTSAESAVFQVTTLAASVSIQRKKRGVTQRLIQTTF